MAAPKSNDLFNIFGQRVLNSEINLRISVLCGHNSEIQRKIYKELERLKGEQTRCALCNVY